MQVSTKELRIQPGRIIEQVSLGEEIIITYHGKALAKIIPINDKELDINSTNELFGMWNDNSNTENVDAYVRTLRKGRQF
jgi:prevent-host-death family protein